MNAEQIIDILYEKYLNNQISQKELLNYLKTIDVLETIFNKKDNQ